MDHQNSQSLPDDLAGRSELAKRLGLSLLLVGVAVAFLWDAARLPQPMAGGIGPAAVPRALALALLALAVAYAASTVRGWRTATKRAPVEQVAPVRAEGLGNVTDTVRSSPLTYMVASGGFILLVPVLGFFTGLAAFAFATAVMARIRWWAAACLALGAAVVLYAAFTLGLDIVFPSGLLV